MTNPNNSSSPFDLFRRNLKPFMIFATLLALVSFVVLPVLQTYMQTRGGAGSDVVLAKYNGKDLTATRVNYFTQNHASTVRFLADLAQETINRGGVPRTSGFDYDAQTKQIRALGINENPSDDSSIRTFMFADQAAQAGFQLDDAALQSWLERFTDGMISQGEITSRLMQATQNRMGPPHLYEQLRHHLLADVYLRRGNSGLFGNAGPLLTPDEQWENFLKLNRNATINSYGVLVNDYLDKTEKEPSASEIREVYEDGKDRDASDQSDEPGFNKQYAATFEYLVGNYQTFLDAERAKLTEEEIRAEYDRRLKGGDFQLPEEATAAAAATAMEEALAEPKEDGNKEDETKEDGNKDGGTEESDATDPADDQTEVKAEIESKMDAEAEEVEETNIDTNADPTDQSDASPTSDSSSVPKNNGIRLVIAQDDTDDTVSEETDTDTEEKPEAEAEADTDTDTDTDTEEKPETDTKMADVKPAAKKPEPKVDTPKVDTPKVETFEDVRESIADDMAGPAARDAMDTAITSVTQAMRGYFSRLGLHQSSLAVGKKSEPPTRPDFEKMASELGLTRETIGPVTETTITDEPINNSFEVGTQFGRRGPGFAVMMFGFDNGQTQLPKQPLFTPVRTADDQAGKIYVAWKTDEKEAYTPSLEEVRDEVVMAIRMKQARELATVAADEIAKEADAGAKLVDLIPEDKKDNYREDLGPFTWMDSFGFQGATIGNVPELDSVGPKFMKAVFLTDEGGFATAANQPGRVVYVVQPTKFDPSIDELRRQFTQPINRMMARMVATDIGEIRNGYYESLDEKAGFEEFEQKQE